ncbi:hypothetical protein CANCADRAFT_111507 [Tortispora caseinolytica NRRL Y-17796]|uniref:Translationally-controlled tumor protein homolog n=1 Tax=Tortispora caseinolytica NRRL Y-17796 TaxID=767744 RepID=A0A1E4TGN8_9ASCO|nr:hypothetical protein CANCADRAFT_111507 [Tortispora caseinolytica NRRL Y-17796]
MAKFVQEEMLKIVTLFLCFGLCCNGAKVYQDVISGDELFSDQYISEADDSMLAVDYAVNDNWTKLDRYKDNNSDKETNNGAAIAPEDLIEAFNLQEIDISYEQFIEYMRRYIKMVVPKYEHDLQKLENYRLIFSNHAKRSTRDLSNVQFFAGRSTYLDKGNGMLLACGQTKSSFCLAWSPGVVEKKIKIY